jgi:uncharacterized membrane protein YraQ (UPF0718 family)
MNDCCEEKPATSGSCHEPGHSVASRPDYFLWFCVASVSLLYFAALFMGHEQGHAFSFATMAHAVQELFNKIWWGLALGVVFVGLLSRIPRDLVMSVLGHEDGFVSLLRATLAGVLLDLCSHGILAVGMKLYERGATAGQVMAFLLASPWNSFSLTLILVGLIGLGWTLAFIGLSLVIGLLTGMVFNALVRGGTLPDNPNRALLDKDADVGLLWREFRRDWNFTFAGTGRLLKDGVSGSRVVIRWALFGILLAALVRSIVPDEVFAVWFGASLAGLSLTVLAATIIEVCSEGTTPIAADLMNRAGAPGNSFSFLMAGVATDYTEIMSIRDTTGSWKIALFLPLVSLPQIMLIGFVLNHF